MRNEIDKTDEPPDATSAIAAKIPEFRDRAAKLDKRSGAAQTLIAELLAALATLAAENEEHRTRFRLVAEITDDVIYERDFYTGNAVFFGDVDTPQGYAKGEYPRTMDGWGDACHPEDLRPIVEASQKCFVTGKPRKTNMRLRRKDGSWTWWLDRAILLRDAGGRPTKWLGVATNISEKVASDETLAAQNELLQQRAAALHELIVELRSERRSAEEQIETIVNQTIMPILRKSRGAHSSPKINGFVQALEKSLQGIASSFGGTAAPHWDALSPREVEIGRLIRDGVSSKRIADLLHISYRSVTTHRNHIRRKLGLGARKINLATYLRKLK